MVKGLLQLLLVVPATIGFSNLGCLVLPKKIYEVEVCSFCFTSYQILPSFIYFFFVSLLNSLYSRVMTSNASQIPGDHVELYSYAQFAN